MLTILPGDAASDGRWTAWGEHRYVQQRGGLLWLTHVSRVLERDSAACVTLGAENDDALMN